MFLLLKEYFKTLSLSNKIMLGVIFLLLFMFAYKSAQYSCSEYQRLKIIEEKYIDLERKVLVLEEKEQELIKDLEVKTKKSKSNNTKLNRKIKKNEEAINNAVFSDDEIRSFISKYNEQ